MKYLLTTLLGILFFTLISFTTKFNPEGQWSYTSSDGKPNQVLFGKDERYYYMLGKYPVKSEYVTYYKFDSKYEPARLDLIVYDLSGNKIKLIEGIAKMNGKDTMLVKFSERQRPAGFEDRYEGEIIKYKRLK